MHIECFPLFPQIYKFFTYFCKNFKFFPYFGSIYVLSDLFRFFASPYFDHDVVYLCIVIYSYWTPLASVHCTLYIAMSPCTPPVSHLRKKKKSEKRSI